MKKYFLIVLAAAAAFVTACGSAENGSSANSAPTSAVCSESGAAASDSALSAEKAPEISGAVTENSREEQPLKKEDDLLNIEITVNKRTFSAALYDNETARAFKARLPLTLDMSELNGNEKYYYLPESLPKDPIRPSMINAGDIMLYGSDCLVIFYESFSPLYSYTPIGKIDDPDGLAEALGSGSVQADIG